MAHDIWAFGRAHASSQGLLLGKTKNKLLSHQRAGNRREFVLNGHLLNGHAYKLHYANRMTFTCEFQKISKPCLFSELLQLQNSSPYFP